MQGGGGNVMSTPTSAQRPGILNSMSPAPNQQISRPRKILFGLHEFFISSVALKVCNFFLCLLLFLQLTRDIDGLGVSKVTCLSNNWLRFFFIFCINFAIFLWNFDKSIIKMTKNLQINCKKPATHISSHLIFGLVNKNSISVHHYTSHIVVL